MLITPSASQSYQLYIDTRFMKSDLIWKETNLVINGMETCDRRSDYIEKVANLVYIYKQFVDRWIFKYNSNFYYDPNMSDCDDTQFNQLYIILKSILAKASIVPILAPTNIPLI